MALDRCGDNLLADVSGFGIGQLRPVAFTDPQISDIALCAAFRNFVSRFFDAMGPGTEAAFLDADEDFHKAMTVGRKV